MFPVSPEKAACSNRISVNHRFVTVKLSKVLQHKTATAAPCPHNCREYFSSIARCRCCNTLFFRQTLSALVPDFLSCPLQAWKEPAPHPPPVKILCPPENRERTSP